MTEELSKRTPQRQTEADLIIKWIETHCQLPNGKPAALTFAQKETVRQIYDSPDGTGPDYIEHPIELELRTYLALCHLCGILAVSQQPVPASLSGVSLFTLWGATGASLKAVLEYRSGAVTCRSLGTRYESEPDAAA